MSPGKTLHPLILAVVVAILCLSGTAAHAQSDNILYGSNKSGQSTEINLTQNTFQVVGSLERGTTASDRDPETGYVYFFEMIDWAGRYGVPGGNGDTFSYWDPETGDVTRVRTYSTPPGPYFKKMAFAPDNTLYMADDEDNLYTIDKNTGDITTLGYVMGLDIGADGTGGDMAFMPDGTLYAVNLTTLFFVDVSTLTATLLYSDMLPAPGGTSHFTGLAYCDGLLYASGLIWANDPNPRDLSGLTEAGIWIVDPANGQTQKVMDTWPPNPLIMVNDLASCIPDGPPDIVAPTVTITSPTSAPSFETESATIALGGTASDDTAVTEVTWGNDRGGSGTASGTDDWSVAAVSLQSGTNLITVTASDAAGNSTSDVLTVTYTPGDVTAPTVTITSPTSAATFTTESSTVNVGGTASDDTGVTSVTWNNDRGGSGTASGTDNWSVAAITLQPGDNQITVTASDAAGNSSNDVITVTYNAPDVTPPAVTITSPTSAATFTTEATTTNLGGTASDNVGVTSVTWANDRGGSGTASGTDNWSVASVALQLGANQITVTATDAAGNSSTDVLTVTREAPNQPPTATITAPANGATFSIGQTLVYAGTATDAEDGTLPASAYTWEAARVGGPFFPLAQGVTGGSSSILQVSGTFIIRLTVQDSEGLTDVDDVTITVQ